MQLQSHGSMALLRCQTGAMSELTGDFHTGLFVSRMSQTEDSRHEQSDGGEFQHEVTCSDTGDERQRCCFRVAAIEGRVG